jgi:hypothetical protein
MMRAPLAYHVMDSCEQAVRTLDSRRWPGLGKKATTGGKEGGGDGARGGVSGGAAPRQGRWCQCRGLG